MHRREAVQLLGGIAAVPFLPRAADAAAALAERVHRAVQAGARFRTFGAAHQALVSRLADAIIPATDTPGALDVRVPEFIDHVVTDWAGASERRALLDGLDDIDARARQAGAPGFVALDATRQARLLEALDRDRDAPAGAGHAFGRIKSLAVFGYFTADAVQRDVLKTVMFFGAYDPCAPL
ncbi:MAG TPA: gluconate 2-dehydrogenase subunit 3 family protein [Gemmatimonadaceae bacterium]